MPLAPGRPLGRVGAPSAAVLGPGPGALSHGYTRGTTHTVCHVSHSALLRTSSHSALGFIVRGDSEPGWGSETVARGAPLRTGACPGVIENGTVLVWSIPCSIHTYRTSFSQHFSQNRRIPLQGHSDAFREPFPASTRQSLPMVAAPGPGVVRGGEWLQYRARVVVIYVSTAPVRRFGRH